MVVALWCRCNRRLTTMDVQSLRRLPWGILGYRRPHRHLLGDRPLGLALRQRWHGRHRRARRACCDRRLAFFVATAKTDMGQTLQQRHPGLLRMLVLDFAAGFRYLLPFNLIP